MNTFHPQAQQVLAFARKEADRTKYSYVDVEHLLLGIIKFRQGTAVDVLRTIGIDIDDLKREIEAVMPDGVKTVAGSIPYSPSVKKVLSLANNEATRMGMNVVGTEHLLLAISEIEMGAGPTILRQKGADADTLRRVTRRILGFSGLAYEPPQFIEPQLDEKIPIPDSSREFTIWIDPGHASVEDIKELFLAASDYHRSLGGNGLTFIKDSQQKPLQLCLG